MANFYFKTLGQAWSAMVAAFTGNNQLTYNTTGFEITWTSGTAPNGGFFTIAGTTFVGEPYANGNYYASEAVTGGYLLINNLIREDGFMDVPQVTSQTTSGALDTYALAYQFTAARAEALSDVYGTGFANSFDFEEPLEGGSVAVATYFGLLWTTPNDVAFDLVCVVDLRGAPTTSPLTWPPLPTYQAVAGATVITNIDVGPQLDTNVAINNGSTINTVTAKQFSGV